jgi:hypothetical protein
MKNDSPDPEKYLDLHFGHKPEYSRPHTLLAMIGYCREGLIRMRAAVLPGAKRKQLPAPPKDFDPLWATAVRIKIGWLCDRRITSADYDRFGAIEIFYLLKMGLTEDQITPEMILSGYRSARWELMNKKLNKN